MGGDAKHLDGILGDLADNLQYRIDEGERVVEIDPAVVKALSGSPAPTAAAAAQARSRFHDAATSGAARRDCPGSCRRRQQRASCQAPGRDSAHAA